MAGPQVSGALLAQPSVATAAGTATVGALPRAGANPAKLWLDQQRDLRSWVQLGELFLCHGFTAPCQVVRPVTRFRSGDLEVGPVRQLLASAITGTHANFFRRFGHLSGHVAYTGNGPHLIAQE